MHRTTIRLSTGQPYGRPAIETGERQNWRRTTYREHAGAAVAGAPRKSGEQVCTFQT